MSQPSVGCIQCSFMVAADASFCPRCERVFSAADMRWMWENQIHGGPPTR